MGGPRRTLQWHGPGLKTAVLGILILAIVPSGSKAGFIKDFSGNTKPQNLTGAGVDGTINFAVLDTTGAAAGNAWGIPDAPNTINNLLVSTFIPGSDGDTGAVSKGLDLTAKYLYLYEPTNNGTNTSAIESVTLSILVDKGSITSWGAFQGLGLAFGKGQAVNAANDFGPAGKFDNPAKANVGLPDSPVAGAVTGPAATPTNVELSTVSFSAFWGAGRRLTDQNRSPIYGFAPPTWPRSLSPHRSRAEGSATRHGALTATAPSRPA